LIDSLKDGMAESVRVYTWLQEQYDAGKVDEPQFQQAYCKFFKIRKFLTPAWKRAYFALLKQQVMDLKTVLEELYKFEDTQGRRTWQLSFASKLLHMQNPHLPIYDSKVKKELKLPTRRAGLDGSLAAYEQLKARYATLLNERRSAIQAFKRTHPKLTDEKALDFLLWGKVSKPGG
jgi:hypothetical protein